MEDGDLNYRYRHQREALGNPDDSGGRLSAWATLATYWGGRTVNNTPGEKMIGAAITESTSELVPMKFHGGILAKDRFLRERDQTTLASNVNASVTSIPIAAALKFAGGDIDYLVIDDEVMRVTAGGSTTTLTVERNALGTTAASHTVPALPAVKNAYRVEKMDIEGIDRASEKDNEMYVRVARVG